MTCPRCQRAVAPVDVFCGFCQARIGAAAPAATGATPSRASAAPRRAAAGVATQEPPAVRDAIELGVTPPAAVEPGRDARLPVPAPDPVAVAASDRLADARPAGFFVRAAAYLVDGVLLLAWLGVAVGVVAASRLFPLVTHGAHPAVWAAAVGELRDLLPLALAVWLPIAALYAVAFLAFEGATPGKMMLRLRVVRPDGGTVRLARAAMRELAGALCTALTLGLAFLAVAFSADKRALHDRLGGTLVVRLP